MVALSRTGTVEASMNQQAVISEICRNKPLGV